MLVLRAGAAYERPRAAQTGRPHRGHVLRQHSATGRLTAMGCPDKKTAALGGEDRAAPGAMAPPQKKRSSHQKALVAHSSRSVVGVLLLALTGLGAAAERAPERPSVAVKRNDNAVVPGTAERPTKPKRRSAVKHSAVAAEPEFMKSVRPAQFASRVDF